MPNISSDTTNATLCYKVEDLCGLLGVSRPVAYSLANRADFPAVRIGRRILIPRSGLEKWLEQQSGGYTTREVICHERH